VKEKKTVTNKDSLSIGVLAAGGFAVHVHLPKPNPAP
jgi:hypothetical protein